MNTAARDRALLPTVKNILGRTPINKLKLTRDMNGSLKVLLHTSRPNNVRMETQALAQALQERIGSDQAVTIEVVPEARAVARFVRASPRKARFVIEVIKGKRVSEAIAMLRFIPNHAAELISKVLISAAANAQDGWGAGVEELKVVNILADGGPSLKRVKPRAQGRAYRILKRTSHLTVILSEAPVSVKPQRAAAAPSKPKSTPAPAAPKPENIVNASLAQTTTEQAQTETALNTPEVTPTMPSRQDTGANTGEETTGDTANTSDSGQSADPANAASEVVPVTAADASEIDMSDRAPDADDADQKRSEGE